MVKTEFIIENKFDENANLNVKSTVEIAFRLYYKLKLKEL